MIERYTIRVTTPAHEMAREEILKQATFLSKEIREIHFSEDGSEIVFSAPVVQGPDLATSVQALAGRIQRALRSLVRKVVFRSPLMEVPHFSEHVDLSDVHFLGTGQVALEGVPLALFRYFDRVFEGFGSPWHAKPLMTPTLIPTRVLARCDYFRSFPQYVTFAAHLKEDAEVIDSFRVRHQTAEDVDSAALADMDRPEACLSPAVCYHVYHLYEGKTIAPFGAVHGICGKCFRFESKNISDLRRLWDFTMREVVFLGRREEVLEARERSIEMMGDFLLKHRLAGEIRTASDPFFIAPDAVSKTYYQLSSDSKFEVSLLLPGGERLAVGSHNYHSDFFGRVFHVGVESGGPMHSVCVAFGLERWVHGFLQQHGGDPASWPDPVRHAPELARVAGLGKSPASSS
jgi:seryl-tRNA synthetase